MSYTTIPSLFTAICNAIRSKDGSSSNINHQDIPSKILAIPTNQGGITLPNNMEMGTFTLEADTFEQITINHNLGVAPIGIFVAIDELNRPGQRPYSTLGGYYLGRNECLVYNNTSGLAYGTAEHVTDITNTSFTLNPRSVNSYPFRAGYTYRWIAWRGVSEE